MRTGPAVIPSCASMYGERMVPEARRPYTAACTGCGASWPSWGWTGCTCSPSGGWAIVLWVDAGESQGDVGTGAESGVDYDRAVHFLDHLAGHGQSQSAAGTVADV